MTLKMEPATLSSQAIHLSVHDSDFCLRTTCDTHCFMCFKMFKAGELRRSIPPEIFVCML